MPTGSGRHGFGKLDLSWPFFCVSISFTKEAIVALRTGELNAHCNALGVMETLHAFHRACFYQFRAKLLAESTTHHAEHLADIRKKCEKSPVDMLVRYLHSKKTSIGGVGGSGSSAYSIASSCIPASKPSAHARNAATIDAIPNDDDVDFSLNMQAQGDEGGWGESRPVQGKAARFLA